MTQRREPHPWAGAVRAQPLRMFPDMLVAYHGRSLLMTDVRGWPEEGIQGFYHHKTRFLSRLGLRINGQPPSFVSASVIDADALSAYFLAPLDSATAGVAGELAKKAIEAQISWFVGEGLRLDVVLTNHTPRPADVTLDWQVDADFHDLCAPPDWCQLCEQAPVERAWQPIEGGGELSIDLGHEHLSHGTRVRFGGAPAEAHEPDGRVRQTLRLPPREPVHLTIDVHPVFSGMRLQLEDDAAGPAFEWLSALRGAERDRWRARQCQLRADHADVQAAWERAVSDLESLPLGLGEGLQGYAPAAGIPIYQALYGRDVLTTGWQAALWSPLMLRGAIETIAARLGRKIDDRFDEQPGRVLHQHQLSPSALLGRTPYLGYYGDYAGPGLFLIALAAYYRHTGDRSFMREMRPSALAVLEWMDRYGDRDGDGFYEYDTAAGETGTKNQGWKDSPEAFVYADGRFAPNPLAAVEIQAYYYEGKRRIAEVFEALGDEATAERLRAEARDLVERFNQAFWLPQERFYALALDPDKRPLSSVSSNVGHCLAAGAVPAERAGIVADRLMAPDMFSGWGIRTLSSAHAAYNPFAYHLGTVWPSENGTIAWGFKRYGLEHHVQALTRAMFEASRLFELHRLPEAFSGHPRDALHPHPGIYPRSCAPQAWSASAVIMLVRSLLGIRPDVPNGRLLIDPALPDWLPSVVLENMPVGDEHLTLRFRRDDHGATDCEVLSGPSRIRLERRAVSED